MLVTLKNLLFKSSGKDRESLNEDDLLNNANYGSTNVEDAIENAKININNSDDSESVATSFFNKFDPRVMSDMIIGLSDGLTVPFALTAGLSSLGDTKLVITGGLAELVSGAISMGLGGYLAAKSESEYYQSQVKKEKQIFFNEPHLINQQVAEIMFESGASENTIGLFLHDLDSSPKNLIDFVIRYGKGLEEPAEGREFTSAITIGSAYFFGGFVPLVPYFFVHSVNQGLLISVLVMLATLFIFGFVKTSIALGDDCGKTKKVLEGIQMVAIGSIAAGSAWSLVYLIDN